VTEATRKFAEFAIASRRWEFPVRAREMAIDAITDCLGCIVAGAAEPLAASLRDVVGGGQAAHDDHPVGPLVGTGRRGTAYDSALYNGALAHAIDYDDVTHPAYAHPGASLTPTILALAAHTNATGPEAITAYILGIEMISKLGRALNTAHYKNGWHATATFGSLGSAATAASLLRLDAEPFAMALAMAASSAGGLRANFGTMTKPLHAGFAARNGVLAALMARAGVTAAADILDHRYGFAGVFNHHDNIDARHFDTWGAPLEILTEFGLGLKPYPACGATHPPIEAAIELRGQLRSLDAIRSVRVGVTEMHFEPMVCAHATTGLEGKFCMGYCIAAALLDGEVTLGTFADVTVPRINASGLPEKVRMELDERVAGNTEFGAVVTIETTDGQVLEKLVPLAIGKPGRWFSKERLAHKFHDCCRGAIAQKTAETLHALAQGLDTATSLDSLIDALDNAVVGGCDD